MVAQLGLMQKEGIDDAIKTIKHFREDISVTQDLLLDVNCYQLKTGADIFYDIVDLIYRILVVHESVRTLMRHCILLKKTISDLKHDVATARILYKFINHYLEMKEKNNKCPSHRQAISSFIASEKHLKAMLVDVKH